jgi:hypothetical protein
MRYVVVIETDDGETDYKVFSSSSDAIQRHDKASTVMAVGEPVSVSGREEAQVVNCAMYKAPTDDAREAIRLVKGGLAEPLIPEEFLTERGPSLDDL